MGVKYMGSPPQDPNDLVPKSYVDANAGIQAIGFDKIVAISQDAYDKLTVREPRTLYITPASGSAPAHAFMDDFSTDGPISAMTITGQPYVVAGSPVKSGGVFPVTADGMFALVDTETLAQTVSVRILGEITTATFPTIVMLATGPDNTEQYRIQRGAGDVLQLNRRHGGIQTTVFSFPSNSFPEGPGLDFELKVSCRQVGATTEFFFWIDGVPLSTTPTVDSAASRPDGTLAGLRTAMTAGGGIYAYDDLSIDAFVTLP